MTLTVDDAELLVSHSVTFGDGYIIYDNASGIQGQVTSAEDLGVLGDALFVTVQPP